MYPRLLKVLSAMIAVMCTTHADPDTFNTSSIHTVNGEDKSYIYIQSVIDDGEVQAEVESHEILIDASNGVAYTEVLTLDNDIWFSGENTYASVRVFQDGNQGYLYQSDNNGEWRRFDCEPFSVVSSVYDFSFGSMCGSGWSVDHETQDEIYLTRSLGSIVGSGYFSDNYVSMFGMFGDTRFTDSASTAVLDKATKRLKSYDEVVKFYADELNGVPEYTADDGKTEIGVREYCCSVHIEISDIGGVRIPEELENGFDSENGSESIKVLGFTPDDFIINEQELNSFEDFGISSLDSSLEGE